MQQGRSHDSEYSYFDDLPEVWLLLLLLLLWLLMLLVVVAVVRACIAQAFEGDADQMHKSQSEATNQNAD